MSTLSVLLFASSLLIPSAGSPDVPDPDVVGASVVRIETLNSVGTGFVVAPGRVLTAAHVVEGTDEPTVVIDGNGLTGRVVNADPRLDVALLDVNGLDAPALAFATDPPKVLDDVYVFGNPLGGVTSASRGIVSAVSERTVQTDAAVNPGNSGGPLLNGAGEVVGLVISKNAEAEGVSFAVPVGRLQDFIGEEAAVDAPPSSSTPPADPNTTVPPTTADRPQPLDGPAAADEPSAMWLLGTVVGAILLVGVVVVAAFRIRSNRRLVITPDDLHAPPDPRKPADERDRIVVGNDVLERNPGHE